MIRDNYDPTILLSKLPNLGIHWVMTLWPLQSFCLNGPFPESFFLLFFFSTVNSGFVHYKILLVSPDFHWQKILATEVILMQPLRKTIDSETCEKHLSVTCEKHLSVKLAKIFENLSVKNGRENVLSVKVGCTILLMTGFEALTSGIGSNHSANWATTTAMQSFI